jgi:hypothetical protein
MATKADFNAEEWSTIVEAPVLAGMRVVTAHGGGTMRESWAVGKVYAEVRRHQGESSLLDELVGSPPQLDRESVKEKGDLPSVTAERLGEALRLLGEKGSPEDVDAYKQFVASIAQAAAEAHKEGGFIGIGGKPVSEEEQGAIDEIKRVLDGAGT